MITTELTSQNGFISQSQLAVEEAAIKNSLLDLKKPCYVIKQQ
jgi:hypothetical protein